VNDVILLSELRIRWEEISGSFIELTKKPDVFLIGLDALGELLAMVVDGDNLYDKLCAEIHQG